MRRLGIEDEVRNAPPDIQSGFFILKGECFINLDLSYVQIYGGELALFFEIVKSRKSWKNILVLTEETRPSSYDIYNIITGIRALPFMTEMTRQEVHLAMRLAPKIYGEYLTPEEKKEYGEQIGKLADLLWG